MKNLSNDTTLIEEFIQKSISRFTSQIGSPNSVGIYCCSSAGWLTTNFNINKPLYKTHNNCPDFEVVEYDFLELPGWQEEYEQENPEFDFNTIKYVHSHDLGDEPLNEFVFNFLTPIVANLKIKDNYVFLLQLIDSKFLKII